MFDTMVITKAVAGLCATLLFFLVGKWVAETVYLPGHDAAHAHAVYPLPSEGGEAVSNEPAVEINVEELYASADASAGESLWRNCRSCHSLEADRNGTGPTLHGVVGRAVDAVAGFNYSGALLQMGDTWTVDALFHFLENPRQAAPGTRMTFAGLRSPQDRVNLIKYLEEQGQL